MERKLLYEFNDNYELKFEYLKGIIIMKKNNMITIKNKN